MGLSDTSRRAKRVARRYMEAPTLVSLTHHAVDEMAPKLDDLAGRVTDLQAELDAMSKAHMEALAFLTRSIEEISVRLEALTKDH